MSQHSTPRKGRSIPAKDGSSPTKDGSRRWQSWQRVARRIRVPLGFLTAAVYLFEVTRHAPHMTAITWSLCLVLPGLALRAAAAGTVKKDRELTVTGPYAYTRNPLYLGSALIASGFAVALLSWPVALLLAAGFAAIYVPVIAAEERFLGAAFPEFESYRLRVPRFIPRLTLAKPHHGNDLSGISRTATQAPAGGFSFTLYLKHREYNAAIGAILLYLSLLFLRPALENLLHAVR
jgi:protein-S-isoprenylcysteine O-methyltransferase Ste14